MYNQENKTEKSTLISTKEIKKENNYFTVNDYLELLVDADSLNQNTVGSETFESGKKTNWHFHHSSEIIIVIEGKGYSQEKGSEKRLHTNEQMKNTSIVPTSLFF